MSERLGSGSRGVGHETGEPTLRVSEEAEAGHHLDDGSSDEPVEEPRVGGGEVLEERDVQPDPADDHGDAAHDQKALEEPRQSRVDALADDLHAPPGGLAGADDLPTCPARGSHDEGDDASLLLVRGLLTAAHEHAVVAHQIADRGGWGVLECAHGLVDGLLEG